MVSVADDEFNVLKQGKEMERGGRRVLLVIRITELDDFHVRHRDIKIRSTAEGR
jgi:hypothetical protein